MSDFVESLKKGQSLSFKESKALFNELMEGKYNENSIIEILESLVKKGETKDELAGGIFVLREKATKVKAEKDTIDTCGTGGDGQNSLNISIIFSELYSAFFPFKFSLFTASIPKVFGSIINSSIIEFLSSTTYVFANGDISSIPSSL